MKKKPSPAISTTPLRRRAEVQLRKQARKKSAVAGDKRSTADPQRLLHELQVHQIELEMQNDELRAARDEMEVGLEKYAELYDFAPVGYFTFTAIGRIRQVNLTGATLVGVERSRLVGQSFALLVTPEQRPVFQTFLEEVMAGRTKQSGEFALLRAGRAPRFVNIEAQCSSNGEECRAAVSDITTRKRAGAQLELLWDAAGVLLSTDDPDAIVRGLFAKLGPALGVDAYFNYLVDETGEGLRLVSAAGFRATRAIEWLAFGEGICGTVAAQRQPMHATQIARSADPKLHALKALGLQAYFCQPLTSGRRLFGTLSYGSRSREKFEADELTVMRTLAHYVAVAYERRHTADALRASEARYHTLFDSMDEGYCIAEVIFNARQKAVDWRYLEVNPAFEKHTGLHGARGKRIRELAPDVEESWFEAYGKVALTGEPVRFANEVKSLNRWFDVYVFRLGGADSRKLAVLFSNITERKQAEAVLSETRAQVAAYAGQLESLVDVRTAQLTATNRRLEASVKSVEQGRERYRLLLEESELMEKQMRHLARQILSAQEDERRKISRDLHDDVVQMLVGINVELAVVRREAADPARSLRAKIGRVQRLVEKTVHAVHQFARELRPAVLDDLGLIPALQAFMKTIVDRKKMKIRLTAFAGVEVLDDERRTVLYRVVQEALQNVVRHAEASLVDVTLSEHPGAVRLEVQDNGVSFDVAQAMSAKTNQRLGLLGLRERVEMLGGSVAIESAAGRGTTVRAELPLSRKEGV